MRWFYLASALALLALVCFNATANAATYTTTCPDPAAYDVQSDAEATALACAALAERIEANAPAAPSGDPAPAGAEDLVIRLDRIVQGLWVLLGVIVGVYAFGFFRQIYRPAGGS
jgi:hypothetical protein